MHLNSSINLQPFARFYANATTEKQQAMPMRQQEQTSTRTQEPTPKGK
jgi:hypothetical protein